MQIKNLLRITLTLAVLCAGSTLVLAAECGYSYTPYPDGQDARVELAMLVSEPNWIVDQQAVRMAGILQHNLAKFQGGRYVGECIEQLRLHLNTNGDDVEARAYYNSCLIMRSSSETNLSAELSQIARSAAVIDQCVNACPQNVNIRLVRIEVTKSLLSLRGHKELIANDYKQILLLWADHPELKDLATDAAAWLQQQQN
ncbi:MAG: hypothetical protein P9M14_14980 [Candidatus Alcyoniella australis]|nr:hypothetical protein [Candidatus Alcyoniella australis]